MKAGFVPVVIQKEQRLAYYEALDQSHVEGDFSRFIQMVANPEVERL
jgi:hypothetical protein